MNESINALAVTLRELGEQRKYNEQGAFFLETTRTTLEVLEAPREWAKDEETGIKYSVTLKNPRGSYTFEYWGSIADKKKLQLAKDAQACGIYSAKYHELMDWCKSQAEAVVPNKIRNKHARGIDTEFTGRTWLNNAYDTVKILIAPKAYDILACLHPMSADSFEDFCAEFGYDEDSQTAERIYQACLAQDNAMRKMFTHAELEALNEIV